MSALKGLTTALKFVPTPWAPILAAAESVTRTPTMDGYAQVQRSPLMTAWFILVWHFLQTMTSVRLVLTSVSRIARTPWDLTLAAAVQVIG